ncbi:MAG TPA: hypothetical protein VM869_34060, partial [Enhygromyxa sp.]|nr:hypothetical protein [Enhygromyxa sp.]
MTVWADRLLADGHPLGQLVALGLRVEQLRLTGSDPTAVEQLDEELADLIERNSETLLGPIASEPAIELEWQYGVVRALTIVSRPYRPWSELRDGFAELVRQPAMRFVDHLHLARPLGWRITNPDGPEAELGLLDLLAHPSSVIRPRRIVFGHMPKRFRLLRTMDERPRMAKLDDVYEQRVRKLLERGLLWMIYDGMTVALPWT